MDLSQVLFTLSQQKYIDNLKQQFQNAKMFPSFACSSEEAFEILKDNPDYTLIVSDCFVSIDSEQGDFCLDLKKKYPHIFRFGICSELNKDISLQAYVRTGLHGYLSCPIDFKELLTKIREVLHLNRLLKDHCPEDFYKIYDTQLPSLPSVYNRVTELAAQEADLSEISMEIEKDPALVLNILKIANSSYYDLNVSDVKRALVFLGVDTVRTLILFDHFSHFIPEGSELYKLVEHTWLTNRYFRQLHQAFFDSSVDEKFNSLGILSNIGLLVLCYIQPDKFKDLLCQGKEFPDRTIDSLEREIFGYDHSIIESFLFKLWGFDYSIIELIVYYLKLREHYHGMHPSLLYLLKLANHLAWKKFGYEMENEGISECLNYLNISPQYFEAVLQELDLE